MVLLLIRKWAYSLIFDIHEMLSVASSGYKVAPSAYFRAAKPWSDMSRLPWPLFGFDSFFLKFKRTLYFCLFRFESFFNSRRARGLCIFADGKSAALRLPFQSTWAARYETVHGLFHYACACLGSSPPAFHEIKKQDRDKPYLVFLVQARGLEPPCPCEHTDLNRARLPIPPCLHE